MDFPSRWRMVEELGKGGQGKVYRVIDTEKYDIGDYRAAIDRYMKLTTRSAKPIGYEEEESEAFQGFHNSVRGILEMHKPENHGALKVLHEAEDARDPLRAQARIEREIQAMSQVTHPST